MADDESPQLPSLADFAAAVHQGQAATQKMFDTLAAGQASLQRGQAELRRDSEHFKETQRLILKHLLEGNGRPSLMARMEVMETRVDDVEQDVADLAGGRSRASEARITGRYSLLSAIVTGLLAAATAIGAAIVSGLLKVG